MAIPVESGENRRHTRSSGEPDPVEPARLGRTFLAEQDGAALFEALAELERDAGQKARYLEVATRKREHARRCAERLCAVGEGLPAVRIPRRTRLLVRLVRWLGGGFAIPVITMRRR